MKELMTSLYEYGEWANARLLAKAALATPAQLAQRFSKGAEPILPTFGHLVGADMRWLARWTEETPPTVAVADFTSLDVVRRRWDDLYAARRAYLARLDEGALQATIRWVREDGAVDLPRCSSAPTTGPSTGPRSPPCSPTWATHPETSTTRSSAWAACAGSGETPPAASRCAAATKGRRAARPDGPRAP